MNTKERYKNICLCSRHTFYKFEYSNSFCISCHYLLWIAKFLTPISLHGSSLTAFPYRYQEFVKTWKLFFYFSGIWKYTRVDWIYSDSCLQGQQGQTFIFKTLRYSAASSTSYYTRVSAKIVVVTICTTYNCRPQHFFVGGTSFRKSSKRYVSRICVEKSASSPNPNPIILWLFYWTVDAVD